MNKLERVRQALRSNRGIAIVGVLEKKQLSDRVGCLGHTIDIYVAPKDGTTYMAKELQELMSSFVPMLEPTWKQGFCRWNHKEGLEILCFDEDIGRETISRQITITDETLFASDGFIDGVRVIEHDEPIRRRTCIRLFPEIRIAAAALKRDRGTDPVSMNETLKRPGLLARIVSFLAHRPSLVKS